MVLRRMRRTAETTLKHVWIKPDLHRRFKIAVTEDGTTMTAKLEQMIAQYLASRKGGKR